MDRNLAADTSAPVVRRMSGVGCRAYRTPPPHRFKNPGRNSATQMRFIPCALFMVGRVRSKLQPLLRGRFFVGNAQRTGEAETASAILVGLAKRCQMLSIATHGAYPRQHPRCGRIRSLGATRAGLEARRLITNAPTTPMMAPTAFTAKSATRPCREGSSIWDASRPPAAMTISTPTCQRCRG